jgi:DNA-binding IclR family transcriptional regulator
MQKHKREAEAFFHDFDYDACTLNLGLDVLEMLLGDDVPETLDVMAARLSTSVDIVRNVVDFLEARGYLIRARADAICSKIDAPEELHVLTPAMRELVLHAGPIMQRVSDDLGQSCNLAVPSAGHLLVIAQTRPDAPYCISVPAGYKYGLSRMAPWISGGADASAAAGYSKTENPFLDDVTDLVCPVMGYNGLAAVLTVPYLRTAASAAMITCASEMMQAAVAISDALTGSRLVA